MSLAQDQIDQRNFNADIWILHQPERVQAATPLTIRLKPQRCTGPRLPGDIHRFDFIGWCCPDTANSSTPSPTVAQPLGRKVTYEPRWPG